jgi:DNA-binding NtrC family response regulator
MPNSTKVLIIDDEIDLCLLLKDYFMRKNYEVTVSHTLEEGTELMSTEKPDVLVLDNNLPDGTGWNQAPGFATSYPDMYIVLVSAFHPSVPKMPTASHFLAIEKPISFSSLDAQFSEL